jgi:hypothetical protein
MAPSGPWWTAKRPTDCLRLSETKLIQLTKTNMPLIKISTEKRVLEGICSLSVEAGSTGYCGGDSGHGGRAVLVLVNENCFDLRLEYAGGGVFIEPKRVSIVVGGDAEMEQFAEALEFAAKTIRAANERKGSVFISA